MFSLIRQRAYPRSSINVCRTKYYDLGFIKKFAP